MEAELLTGDAIAQRWSRYAGHEIAAVLGLGGTRFPVLGEDACGDLVERGHRGWLSRRPRACHLACPARGGLVSA